MKRRWIGVLMGTALVALLLGSPALAFYRWHVNDGIGYGIYNLSWGKLNEFNQAFESFTQDMGIEDFEIEELEDRSPVLSIYRKLEVSPHLELELSLSGLLGGLISESEERNTLLPGGGERWMNAGYNLLAGMVFGNVTGYYKFNPDKRFSPYIGGGIGGYFVNVKGSYSYSEETFTPPWDYQSRYLQEDFSLSDAVVGYTLAVGCDWMVIKSVFDIQVGLRATYHRLPEMTGQFDYVGIEGFSEFPVEPVSFQLNPSGSQIEAYILVRF